MTRRGSRRRGPTRWERTGWPLLAGAVGAVGMFGACLAFGALGLACVSLTLTLLSAVTLWGLAEEFSLTRAQVVRIVVFVTPVVLVLAGLTQLFAGYGLAVAAVVTLTWPPVMRRLRRSPKRSKGTAPPAGGGLLLDTALVDRRFEEIVRELRATGDFPTSSDQS